MLHGEHANPLCMPPTGCPVPHGGMTPISLGEDANNSVFPVWWSVISAVTAVYVNIFDIILATAW